MVAPGLVTHLHLFVVHAAAALLLAGTAFLIVGKTFGSRAWADALLHAGRWNLYLAAFLAATSVGSGWFALLEFRTDAMAYATAALHRRTALVGCVLSVAAAIVVCRTRQRAPGWIVLAILLIASCSITLSALSGAQLVYRHGWGIERPREEPRMPVAQMTRAGAGLSVDFRKRREPMPGGSDGDVLSPTVAKVDRQARTGTRRRSEAFKSRSPMSPRSGSLPFTSTPALPMPAPT